MMRAIVFAGLLVSSALAGDSCPAPPQRGRTGNFAPAAGGNSVGSAITHTWTRVGPAEVSSSLASLASVSPALVTPVTSAVGGYLTSSVRPPKGVSSIYPTAPALTSIPALPTLLPSTLATVRSSNYTYTTSSLSATKASSTSVSSSSTSSAGGCASPTVVLEWRQMTPQQQQALTDANLCLMLQPPRANLPGAKSLWDELVVVHQQMAPTVHGTGNFLSFHRQFLYVYEQQLRTACAFTGPMAWWDETLDSGDFHNAPMLSPTFYGTGVVSSNAQCVNNGVYAGLIEHIGPGDSDTNHCLSRGIDESLSAVVTNDFVNQCNSYSNFLQMEQCQYLGPHGYTHDAIGGVMSDVASSPGDPMFFLHHHFVDRNWRNWQLVDPSVRTYAIGGFTTPACQNSDGGAGCVPTTLNDIVSTIDYYPDVTIAQVADTQGGHLCYYYSY